MYTYFLRTVTLKGRNRQGRDHRLLANVVVVLTLTRTIKSVVTGQAPAAVEMRNTPGKNTNKPKVVHAYFRAVQAAAAIPTPPRLQRSLISHHTHHCLELVPRVSQTPTFVRPKALHHCPPPPPPHNEITTI